MDIHDKYVLESVSIEYEEVASVDTPWGSVRVSWDYDGIHIEVYRLCVDDAPVAKFQVGGSLLEVDR